MTFPGGPGGGPFKGGPYQSPQNPGGIKPGPLKSVPALDLLLLLIIWLGVQKLLPFLFLNTAGPHGLGADAGGRSLILPGLTLIALHSVIMLGAFYFILIKKHNLRLADLGIVLISKGWVLRAAVFGALAVPASGIIAQFFQAFYEEPFQNPQQDLFVSGGFSFGLLIFSLLVTGAFVPLVEEIAFRGVFYGWLRARMPLAASVTISSLVFAFLHGIPFLFPIFALIGALLALITEKSGSILAATITHGVFNAIGIVMLYSLLYQGWSPPGAG